MLYLLLCFQLSLKNEFLFFSITNVAESMQNIQENFCNILESRTSGQVQQPDQIRISRKVKSIIRATCSLNLCCNCNTTAFFPAVVELLLNTGQFGYKLCSLLQENPARAGRLEQTTVIPYNLTHPVIPCHRDEPQEGLLQNDANTSQGLPRKLCVWTSNTSQFFELTLKSDNRTIKLCLMLLAIIVSAAYIIDTNSSRNFWHGMCQSNSSYIP